MAEKVDPRSGEIDIKLDSLEERVGCDTKRIKRGTTITLVVGLILFVIIFSYLTWLVDFFIKPNLEPEQFAETASGMISQRLREALPNLEKNLTESAPDNIAMARKEAMSQAPELRKLIEDNIYSIINLAITKLDESLDEMIAQLIADHKEELMPLIEAASIEGQPDELEKAFREALDELVLAKLDDIIKKFNDTMNMVDSRLNRLLLPDEHLTPDEVMLKEWITALMIAIDDGARREIGEVIETN